MPEFINFKLFQKYSLCCAACSFPLIFLCITDLCPYLSPRRAKEMRNWGGCMHNNIFHVNMLMLDKDVKIYMNHFLIKLHNILVFTFNNKYKCFFPPNSQLITSYQNSIYSHISSAKIPQTAPKQKQQQQQQQQNWTVLIIKDIFSSSIHTGPKQGERSFWSSSHQAFRSESGEESDSPWGNPAANKSCSNKGPSHQGTAEREGGVGGLHEGSREDKWKARRKGQWDCLMALGPRGREEWARGRKAVVERKGEPV